MTSDFARRAYGSFGRLGPGSRIAGYLIEEQIGAGGMAVVFLARDEMLGRPAAVKVIAPSMADDAEFRARFLRESRAAAAVDSLHIIPVFGAGEAEGLLYIATRFVADGDLARLLRRSGGRLSADRVVSLVAQVASALDAAHATGLVHRDVKPQNILIDSVPERPEHAYLSDFGLSKRTQSTGLTATGQFLGTPDYSAPEQIRASNVDGRADQYALGCVAYTLLTGSLPFPREETVATLFAHLQDPAPLVTELHPELPPAVDGVIVRALAKSPADRYDRCGEFAAALQAALGPAQPAAFPGRTEPAREGPAVVSGPQSPGESLTRQPTVPPTPPSLGAQPPAASGRLASQLPTGSQSPQVPETVDLFQAAGSTGPGERGESGPSQATQAPETVDRFQSAGPTSPGGRGQSGHSERHRGNGRHKDSTADWWRQWLGKGDWWRHWTWKKTAVLVGGVFAFFILGLFGAYEYLSSSATIPAALASANYQDTTVYYADGTTVMGTFGQTDRQDLTYQQIPMSLQDAVVAAQDKNFWTEGGISPTGILDAAIHDVMGGSDPSGGSTITQEFVRDYYDSSGAKESASSEIKEIFIAQKIASTYSKQWIMTNYLNMVYLGENSYGIEAAAETYFGVPVSKLTISQDAVLAGLLQQPSTYSLPANRQALVTRWQSVLQQMVADKYLTPAQAAAQKFPTILTDQSGGNAGGGGTANGSDPWAPYLLTQVYNEIIADGVTAQRLDDDGLKIVTTISRPMEVEMYKAVNENLSGSSISKTSGSTQSSLPSWALVGAELQDPKTGEIIAEYPGKGQGLPAAQCKIADCDENTAAYTREQVGSSFKPYVLATAVSRGMNVKTSTLDTSPYLCVMPDGSSAASVPVTASTYSLPGTATGCPSSDAYKVENDGGEPIGKQVVTGSSGAASYSDNVQDALARSSNTGFTDLAHKVGTKNIVSMASDFGVNTSSFADGGSGLVSYEGDVGMALGIAPLTVQEQATMLATIDDNGLYHQAHLIKYWQQGTAGAEQTPKVDEHVVLQPNLDAEVQYAMEKTTIDGTAAATVTFGRDNLGTVIGETGTTSNSHSGFFIGATTQYSLVVGLFTANPQSSDNLAMLGGDGFSDYWPAKIWNTFADAEFSKTPQLFPTNPAFSGTAWNLLGSVPKAAPETPVPETPVPENTTNSGGQGGTTTPSPTVTCNPTTDPNCTVNPDGSVSCDLTTDPNCTVVSSPTETVTCDPTVDHSCTVNPNGTVTCNPTADPDCTIVPGNTTGNGDSVSATPTVTASGAAAGGMLLLPGSVLLVRVTRRRKRFVIGGLVRLLGSRGLGGRGSGRRCASV